MNEKYICKIASLEEMNQKWDYEIRQHPETENWTVWKGEAIEGFKAGRSIPYYGVLDGMVICEATAVLYPDFPLECGETDEHTVELCAFRTMKAYRGKGYFSKLMRFMLRDLEQKGYTKAVVGVEPQEELNRQIYHHWGFTEYVCTGTETYPDGTVIDIAFYGRQMTAKHVVVEPYSETWTKNLIGIRNEIRDALDDLALRIEHIGSTAVPGLSAKPIIDIDVVITDYSVFDEIVHRLGKIGYRPEGNLGIAGREAFKYDGKDHLQKHHLYVCTQDSEELKRHVAFRDYLRAHPEAVQEYGRIKEEGAALYPYNIEKYIRHKAPFIERIYREIEV